MRLENAARLSGGAFSCSIAGRGQRPQFATFKANGSRSRLVGCVGPPMRQMAEDADFERELIRERTGEGRKRAMAAGVSGRVKTKSNLVAALSGGGIFAFFCSERDRKPQNSGCGYTA